MTLQEAFKAWQDTQPLSTLSSESFSKRNYTWDVYCAIRDGLEPSYYASRREKYGRPTLSDAEIRLIESSRAQRHSRVSLIT